MNPFREKKSILKMMKAMVRSEEPRDDGAALRIKETVDRGSFREIGKNLKVLNPLDFPGYSEKLRAVGEKTGLKDAVVMGAASWDGRIIAL